MRQRRHGLPRGRHDRRREERPLRDAEEPLRTPALIGLLTIVATTPELESLAHSVGGDLVAATTSSPPARTRSRSSRARRTSPAFGEARAVVRVGVDYDLWLDRGTLREARHVHVIDASTYVALLDVRAREAWAPATATLTAARRNPHYWLDP